MPMGVTLRPDQVNMEATDVALEKADVEQDR
jgi:hypothetical protein